MCFRKETRQKVDQKTEFQSDAKQKASVNEKNVNNGLEVVAKGDGKEPRIRERQIGTVPYYFVFCAFRTRRILHVFRSTGTKTVLHRKQHEI